MADLVFPGTPTSGVLNQYKIPNNYDMRIYKGDYVELFVTLNGKDDLPLNLTGFNPSASLRPTHDSETVVNFTCTVTEPAAGKVRIYLPSSASKELVEASYVWDFQVANPDGDVRTYLTGDVTVYSEVTRQSGTTAPAEPT